MKDTVLIHPCHPRNPRFTFCLARKARITDRPSLAGADNQRSNQKDRCSPGPVQCLVIRQAVPRELNHIRGNDRASLADRSRNCGSGARCGPGGAASQKTSRKARRASAKAPPTSPSRYAPARTFPRPAPAARARPSCSSGDRRRRTRPTSTATARHTRTSRAARASSPMPSEGRSALQLQWSKPAPGCRHPNPRPKSARSPPIATGPTRRVQRMRSTQRGE